MEGILFYLLNHRPGGQDRLIGAGIAEVHINAESVDQIVPRAKRLCKYWWSADTEPSYGDVCALRHDGFVYAYGHMKDNPWIYLTRVLVHNVLDVSAYEYWNGSFWQRERLDGPKLSEKESIFWKIQQGQIVWSAYHERFIFIYCDAWWTDQVLVCTATLCGPGICAEDQVAKLPIS